MTSLWRDQRGAAVPEFLVTFPVLLYFYFGLYMLVYMLTAHVVVQRAADAAARAAVVFLPDPEVYYGAGSFTKEQYIEKAADAALAASADLLILDSVSYNSPQYFDPLRAEVRAHFDCSYFLAQHLCGLDKQVSMVAEATFPYQGTYPDD